MKPAESPDSEERRPGEAVWIRLLEWFGILSGIYIMPFVVVFIDEFVLRTYWFVNHLPAGMEGIFRAVYPFHRLFVPGLP